MSFVLKNLFLYPKQDVYLLRFLSTYTRRMLVVSQSGQFLMIEDNAAVTPNTPIYQVNLPGSSIMNVDISRSMQAMAFADSSKFENVICCVIILVVKWMSCVQNIEKYPNNGVACVFNLN